MKPAKGALELKTTECSAENAGTNKHAHATGAAVNTEWSSAAWHLKKTKNRCGVSALRWCGVKYGRAPNGHFTHMKDSKQVRLFQESVVFEVSAAIGGGGLAVDETSSCSAVWISRCEACGCRRQTVLLNSLVFPRALKVWWVLFSSNRWEVGDTKASLNIVLKTWPLSQWLAARPEHYL